MGEGEGFLGRLVLTAGRCGGGPQVRGLQFALVEPGGEQDALVHIQGVQVALVHLRGMKVALVHLKGVMVALSVSGPRVEGRDGGGGEGLQDALGTGG